MNDKRMVIAAATLGALGVAAGAFGAHYLEPWLRSQGLAVEEISRRAAWLETGVRYQLVHAVALLALAGWQRSRPEVAAGKAAGAMLLGVVIFSGCLQLMTLTGVRWLGAVVPIGGVLMIVGWTMLAFVAAKARA